MCTLVPIGQMMKLKVKVYAAGLKACSYQEAELGLKLRCSGLRD